MTKRRDLTPEEKAESARLAQVWTSYKHQNRGASQEWLSKKAKIGTQSLVSQYLRGFIPLNIGALVAICRVLGADPREISPRLMSVFDGKERLEGESAGVGLADNLQLAAETINELRLLATYRDADEEGRDAFDKLVAITRRRIAAARQVNKS
jgi:hypothetical protein